MTVTREPDTSSGIDFGAIDSAIGLNWYDADPNLRQLMERLALPEDHAFAEQQLRKMGGVIGGPVAARAEITDKNPPRLEKYDAWGNETNDIVHHQSAIDTKRDLWENGFLGLRWTDEVRKTRAGHLPPVVNTGFLYFLNQAETGMACGIGMTSSAAGIINRHAPPEIRDRFLPHLTTMDFAEAWAGGMFMTEVRGGSDLASSECAARKTPDGWRITGAKWFCSNLDAEAILTLARPEGGAAGLPGLAQFLVPKFRADGSRNGVHIRRLKDKLGTKAVPTGEVDFEDAEAYLMGAERADSERPDGDRAASDGRGVNRMMEMVQGSRFGVALMGLGIMRRSFLEAAIYAHHRTAFGQLIADFPLVKETLVEMAIEVEAGCVLAFEAAEAGARRDPDSQRLYRILVPLAKLRCARRGLDLASQAVEIHGGNGYIENWPVARQLRDAQCHTIWEGTENIICLDVLRSMQKEHADEALFARVERALGAAEHPALTDTISQVGRSVDDLKEAIAWLERAPQDVRLLQARRLSNYMADVAQAALLVEEAVWELANKNSARKAVVARYFAATRLADRPQRGITSTDTTVLDYFDPIVRYQPIAPASLSSGFIAVAAPPILPAKMLRRLLLFCVLALVPLGCSSQAGCDSANGCTRVLFIGNSYTSVNDLPATFAKLAKSGGHNVHTGMSAPGGWSLADHAASADTASALALTKWDYVVLQEQSEIPSSSAARQSQMYPAARLLVRRVQDAAATPIFFLTWAHRNGWPENRLDYAGMQSATNVAYRSIAGEQRVAVAPVGAAWSSVVSQEADPQIWQDDGSHPTEKGTYLAACVFYATIFRVSPEGLAYIGRVPADEAKRLQAIAAHTVFDDALAWNLR